MAAPSNVNLSAEILDNEFLNTFSFPHLGDRANSSDITVIEVVDKGLNSSIGGCARMMALYLWSHQNDLNLKNKRVLELGVGPSSGVAGVVAAKCGASAVSISKYASTTEDIVRLQRTCQINDLTLNQITVKGITVGALATTLRFMKPVDLIICSDSSCSAEFYQDFISAVSYIRDNNPNCVFLTTCKQIELDWRTERFLNNHNLESCRIRVDDLGSDLQIDMDEWLDKQHSECIHHMFKISRKS